LDDVESSSLVFLRLGACEGEKENPLARNKGDTLIVRNRSMALS